MRSFFYRHGGGKILGEEHTIFIQVKNVSNLRHHKGLF